MSTTEIQVLRTELEHTKQELAQLKQALDLFINEGDIFAPAEAAVWRKAKRSAAIGVTEAPSDTTVGKNLPAPPVKTVNNGIGA